VCSPSSVRADRRHWPSTTAPAASSTQRAGHSSAEAQRPGDDGPARYGEADGGEPIGVDFSQPRDAADVVSLPTLEAVERRRAIGDDADDLPSLRDGVQRLHYPQHIAGMTAGTHQHETSRLHRLGSFHVRA
jgi:hypothetical protein